MKSAEIEAQGKSGPDGAVSLYCLATLVVEEAQRHGRAGFARQMESAMAGLLEEMPRAEQSQALRLAYEMAMAGENPTTPKLRLVYSRD